MNDKNSIPAEFETVADVARAGLCCFCGACQAVCPKDSVSLDLSQSFPVPCVDDNTCNNCGLCVEICPGHSVDFETLNTDFFGKPATDKVLGNFIETYIGAVTDDDRRYHRTSGGIAKGIAAWGLEKGHWQGVVVSRFSTESIRKTETFVATTAEQIESASSSLYCPVPVCSIFKRLKDFPGRVCIVALPCQVHALRKAQQKLDWLREKVAFTIGLFCSSTPGFDATEAFLKYHHIDPAKVSSLKYRSEGWPGEMLVHIRAETQPCRFKWGVGGTLFDRFKFGVAFHRRGGFACRRCLTCADYTAELADVSLGDPWHMGFNKEKLGLNIIIVRSQKARELFDKAQQEKQIFRKQIPSWQVVASHRGNLLSKKKTAAMFDLLSKKKISRPAYTGQPELGRSIWETLVARLEIAQFRLAQNRKRWPLLPLLVPPMSILRRIAGRTKTKL